MNLHEQARAEAEKHPTTSSTSSAPCSPSSTRVHPMRDIAQRYTLGMTRSRNVAKIIGVGLIALVAGILLLHWVGGLGVQSTELDVDQYGNLYEVNE